MREIKTLTLSFPHGASIKDCDVIAQYAQDQVMAGVSEGGMAVTSKYGLNVDGATFSEDHMHYIFGHNRNQSGPELECCSKCKSVTFLIVRDMTSRRVCSCGNSWECPK